MNGLFSELLTDQDSHSFNSDNTGVDTGIYYVHVYFEQGIKIDVSQKVYQTGSKEVYGLEHSRECNRKPVVSEKVTELKQVFIDKTPGLIKNIQYLHSPGSFSSNKRNDFIDFFENMCQVQEKNHSILKNEIA